MQNYRKNVPILLILACLGLAYSNSFLVPFHYDDSVNIYRNKNIHITALDWPSIKGTLFAGGRKGDIYHPTLYRPLPMLSFALNYYFHKFEPLGYHLVNFTVHALTALFLFLFLRLTLTMVCLKGRYARCGPVLALLAALLWAINPVQLTSVTYVVQRMTAMAGLFYIMAMYFYLKGRSESRPWFYVGMFVSIFFAVTSKENAIMVFAAIGLFEFMFFSKASTKTYLLAVGVALIAGFLLMIATSGIETLSIDKLMAGYEKRDFTLSQRLFTEPRVILFYILLLCFPSNSLLSLTHTVPISNGLFDPIETSLAILMLAIILAIAIIKAREYPLISYCVFFFFLNHLIEGTIFPLELVYEHRNYVPSMLFFVPIAILIIKGYESSIRFKKVVALCSISFFVFFFTTTTYKQNIVWQTDLGLWTDTASKSHDPRSLFNLGGAYYTLKDNDKALKYWSLSGGYNERFGTNYTKDTIPYGRVIAMAKHNAMLLNMLVRGRVRNAWTSKYDLSKYCEIRK